MDLPSIIPLLGRARDLLFVPGCAACDRPVGIDEPLCAGCAVSLVELGPACPRCAQPRDAPGSFVCARCLAHAPPYLRIAAPWRYGGELAAALRRLKFGGRVEVARQLAPLLGLELADTVAADRTDLAVAIPLHWRRLAARTFNQAALLLRHAMRAASLGLPIAAAALVRVRATAPQTGLSAARRAGNVDGAFAVPARAVRQLAGRRVLLFDDVVTTGATMAAAARVLRAAGAAEVVGFCAARAE